MAKPWSTNFNYITLGLDYFKDCLLRVKNNTTSFCLIPYHPECLDKASTKLQLSPNFFYNHICGKTQHKSIIPDEQGVCLKLYGSSVARWQKSSVLEKAPNNQSDFHFNPMFLIIYSLRKTIKIGLNRKCNIDMMSLLNVTGGTKIWLSKEKIIHCTSQYWNHTWDKGKKSS